MKNIIRFVLVFGGIAFVFYFTFGASTAGEDTRFSLRDVFSLEYASDPQISLDGRQIVYVRNFMDIMADQPRSNLWIINYDGSEHRPLTTGNRNDFSPRCFVLTADAYNFFYKYWFPGFPWEHPEHYLNRSPLSLVGNVKTPTMLLTGELDYRTPIAESEQFYQALKLRGIDTALVRLPEASHNTDTRPSYLIAKVAHILKWFERYRKTAD